MPASSVKIDPAGFGFFKGFILFASIHPLMTIPFTAAGPKKKEIPFLRWVFWTRVLPFVACRATTKRGQRSLDEHGHEGAAELRGLAEEGARIWCP